MCVLGAWIYHKKPEYLKAYMRVRDKFKLKNEEKLQEQQSSEIKSINKISMIKKDRVKMPLFYITRMDDEEYQLSEADFDSLKMDDIIFIYNYLIDLNESLPEVDNMYKPIKGTIFDSIDVAYNVYQQYAQCGGFEIWKATQTPARRQKGDDGPRKIKLKYFMCSREGFKPSKPCKVLDNNERHQKGEGHVDTNNMESGGPTVGHRILTTILGGLDKVCATPVDCRNLKRDIIAYIGKADAQIMVNMLTQRKKCLPDFSLEYFVDEKGVLRGFFWADEYSKHNCSAFGDVVSLDATIRTNKYYMVFIPFTGIDSHKKSVTFGARMLAKEDAYSYKWLLNCFKTAFPDEPMIGMTDQDPAMKIAIEDVFETAHHRLCMWHIMKKFTIKVGVSICSSGLKARLAQIVWTSKLQPEDLEKRWGGVMSKFILKEHMWLVAMFNLRHNWIPAYFHESRMSGLMRTSSSFESENHMFG
ncbi:protein FAR1-RELATED SEQUENCE 5-like [Rutidosis leptorrhynchoides]|uniref:protein FAR1-RELATED SEQUENCE 5-like n=1 Tax=Rutidosis leptorrhynchoides TaxID=125765 RepID=UPI003A990E7F